MTPDDVIKNIERVRDPKTASPYASRFTGIKSMQATGPHTLRLVLDAPSAPFLVQLASLAIVAPEAVGEIGRKPVGTGPFRFTQWVPDTFIALEKNPSYWDQGLPKLAGLKFNIVPESATRELGIAGGSYRMLPVVDASSAAALTGKPGVRIMDSAGPRLRAGRPEREPRRRSTSRRCARRSTWRSIAARSFRPRISAAAFQAGPLSPALTDWALPISDFPCYKPDAAGAKKKLQDAGADVAREAHAERSRLAAAGGRYRAGRAGAAQQSRL